MGAEQTSLARVRDALGPRDLSAHPAYRQMPSPSLQEQPPQTQRLSFHSVVDYFLLGL